MYSLLVLCSVSFSLSLASTLPPVWSGSIGAATLDVFGDDTYSLSANDTVVLNSGTTAVHLNNSWWVASSTGGDVCSNITDVDCRGNDIYYFNTSSASECCENCSATESCGAWTYTGVTAPPLSAPPSWAYRCYIKSDCNRQSYAGHVSGVKAQQSNPLTRLGAGPISGTHPSLGAYTGWKIDYVAGSTPVSTSFLSFPTTAVLLFNLTLPDGATLMNLSTPINSTEKSYVGEFSSSQVPSTQFPVWTPVPGLRFVSWGGRFFSDFSGEWANAMTQGAEGGPISFFAAQAQPQAFSAVVLAPFDHFKSSLFGSSFGEGAFASGLNGYVPEVKAGFSLATSVTASASGVTDAMHAWGRTLLSSRGTVRARDPTSEVLTYFTDNGAFYDWYAYEPDINSAGVVQDILEALADTFRNGTYGSTRLPVGMFMLDAYWMYNTRSNGNCKMNDTAWPLPLPRGLTELSSNVGPLILYNGPMCGNTTYADAWPLEMSLYWNQGWGEGVLSAITANASLPFHTDLFAQLKAQGMGAFTQDFLDFQGLLFPGFLESEDGNSVWLRGQADAAFDADISIQYCMSLPGDILQSAEFPAVTNARASQDYSAGGSNWRIGGSSLLLSALELRASKDNFWTGPPNKRGHETSPFLVAAITALSGGPVGIADPLFGTNTDVVWPAITLNGTILHASRPATIVDSHWSGVPDFVSWDVRVAHSDISGSAPLRAYSVFADSAAPTIPTKLSLADLWPSPTAVPDVTTPAPRFYLWAFNSPGCVQGGAAEQCVVELGTGGAAPQPPPTPTGDAVPWGLWNAVPILANGFALLGEVDKYVAVSPARFIDVRIGDGGVGVGITLAGAPAETVHIAYFRPVAGGPLVVVANLTLNNDGMLRENLV